MKLIRTAALLLSIVLLSYQSFAQEKIKYNSLTYIMFSNAVTYDSILVKQGFYSVGGQTGTEYNTANYKRFNEAGNYYEIISLRYEKAGNSTIQSVRYGTFNKDDFYAIRAECSANPKRKGSMGKIEDGCSSVEYKDALTTSIFKNCYDKVNERTYYIIDFSWDTSIFKN